MTVRDRAPLLSAADPPEKSTGQPNVVVRVVRSGGIAILAGTTLGLTIGNMSAVLDKNQDEGIVQKFDISDDGLEVQIIGAMMQVGCVVGAAAGFLICDAKGRRPSIVLSALCLCAGSVLAGLANTILLITAGRFLSGVGQGMACHSVPIYVSEVAERRWRAQLDASFQLAINAGILLGYAVNIPFMSVTGGYHFALGMPLPLAGLFLLGMLALPESPRWLAQRPGREADALQVLLTVRESEREAAAELREIREVIEDELSGTGSWADLVAPGQRGVVCVGLLMCMLQVATGIDIFTTYATRTFDLCGWGARDTEAQLLIGGLLLCFTMVPIMAVEHIGARNLLLFGGSGMTMSFALLAVFVSFTEPPGLAPISDGEAAAPDAGTVTRASYLTVGAMLLVVVFFSCSWGPLAWVIPSEVFSLKVRAKAMSVGTCLNWIADWAVVFSFLSLKSAVGYSATYAGYAVINLFAVVFVWCAVKDHRGLRLEEIQALYGAAGPVGSPTRESAAEDGFMS